MTTRTSAQRRSTAAHPPWAATERPSSGRRLMRRHETHPIAVEALARTICAIISRRPFTASTTLAESRRSCRPNSTSVPAHPAGDGDAPPLRALRRSAPLTSRMHRTTGRHHRTEFATASTTGMPEVTAAAALASSRHTKLVRHLLTLPSGPGWKPAVRALLRATACAGAGMKTMIVAVKRGFTYLECVTIMTMAREALALSSTRHQGCLQC